MTERKNIGWIKFVPSLDLPKERVSIAYDTHDERGVRYAYGYFQFYNGTCCCFWKDGNEQPKVVKAEDIKYWMPVPSLDVQKEPVSDDLEQAIDTYLATYFGGEKEKQDWPFLKKMAIHFAEWQKQQMEAYRIEHCKSLTNEQAELEDTFVSSHVEKNNRIPTFIDAIEYGIEYGKQQMLKNAVSGHIGQTVNGLLRALSDEVDDDLGFEAGNKVKLIIIKEE